MAIKTKDIVNRLIMGDVLPKTALKYMDFYQFEYMLDELKSHGMCLAMYRAKQTDEVGRIWYYCDGICATKDTETEKETKING